MLLYLSTAAHGHSAAHWNGIIMERSIPTMLRIGDWCVNPASGQISRNGETTRLEARTMRLLLRLAEHPGEVVSIDDLLNHVWSGVTVTPDSVYQAVASLRRLLGDDPKQPMYIATVPRLGYRMVSSVGPWLDGSEKQSVVAQVSAAGIPQSQISTSSRIANPKGRLRFRAVLMVGLGVCLVLSVGYFLYSRAGQTRQSFLPAGVSQPQKSIAVLPFLDLTEGMHEETFADGMTEELIDRLSKIPGLRVPAPTSSFYFRGKQVPVSEIAQVLGVAYVLDGSVRESGTRVRVAARLIRPSNGYVVWSETYDRPLGDVLWIQDDIAENATKALRATIEGGPEPVEKQ